MAAPEGWQEAGVDADVDLEAGWGVDVDPGVAAGEGFAPKMRANLASLYTQIPMFTAVVVRNLAVPGKTVEKGLSRTVEVKVSMVFAVR